MWRLLITGALAVALLIPRPGRAEEPELSAEQAHAEAALPEAPPPTAAEPLGDEDRELIENLELLEELEAVENLELLLEVSRED